MPRVSLKHLPHHRPHHKAEESESSHKPKHKKESKYEALHPSQQEIKLGSGKNAVSFTLSLRNNGSTLSYDKKQWAIVKTQITQGFNKLCTSVSAKVAAEILNSESWVWDFDHAEFRFAKDAKSATEIVDLSKTDKTKKMNERLAQFFSEQMDLVPGVPMPRPETDTTHSRLSGKVGGSNGSLEDIDIVTLFDLLKNKAGNEHFDYHSPIVWDDNAVGRKNKNNPKLFQDIVEKAREKAKLIAVPLRIKGDYVIVFFDSDKKKRYIFDPKGTTRLDDLDKHFKFKKFWMGWQTVRLNKKIQKDNYNSGSYIYHLTRLLVASKDPEKDFTDYAELSEEDLAKQKAEWAKDVKPAEVPEALPVPAKKWWEFWKKA